VDHPIHLGQAHARRTVDARKVYVIDGDTVAIARERIRVLGIDAPETREARCERERVAGYQTKARVVDLLRFGRSIDIHRQGHDGYGRTLARIIVDGRDLGEQLVREKLATPLPIRRRGQSRTHGTLVRPRPRRPVTNAVTSNSPDTRRRPIFRPRRLWKFVHLVLVGNTPQGCAMRHGLDSAPSQELRAARIGYNGTTREDGLRHR
jgi:endonuclease YncB( thermonuclease family)